MKISSNFSVFFAINILLLCVFLLPKAVYSAEILKDLEINLSKEKVYEKNLYVGAGKSFIESIMKEDLVVFSGESVIVGDVLGDLFLMGGKIDFSGNVLGDLRIFGGDVKISGKVGGDVLIVGGSVEILETAEVKREIFVIGGKTIIKNNVSDKLKIISGRVNLNGKISSLAEITTQNLRIGNGADISGDLFYYAPQKFIKDSDANISGKISFNEINSIREMGIVKKAILSFMSFWFLLRFITTLILAFILIYIFKPFSQNVIDLISNSFWKNVLASILILFIGPFIISLLIMSLVGLPIGFLILMTLIFIFIISPAISGIFLGYWLKKYFNKNTTKEVDFQGASIGVIILTLLQFLPVAGGIIRFILFMVSIGAISRQIRLAILK
ncbi:MAG TPA: hypothetical protein PJ997_02410 [Candidatus Paceibacterota bacterium]|nr:hypothetical protein [Candidatus Paceibacterota bacterium]HMP19165.1 hypothetical protein [Candidatus Paceibacterota bacterium]HMP85216.1 hypothetical protein [Candidatus Paceibacterota bacterium]